MGKDVGIKVNVKGDPKGIRDLKNETVNAAGTMKSALHGALSEGMKGGTDALKGMASSIKSVVGTLGGLAGGLGVAELLRGAIESEGAYRKLAFQIRAGTGELVSMRDVQKETHAAALATGQASDDLAKAMAGVYAETGDADFARNTMATIGTAATGAHEPLETMANLAGTLNEKFGITEETLGATLASITSLGNKGGVSVADLGEKLGMIGAFAKEAGLEGEEGIGTIIGLMNIADNSTGNFKKGMSAVGGILEQLSNTTSKAKIGAALGISTKDMKGDIVSQIAAIEKATKGDKGKLEKAFGGEQLKVLVDLGKTYSGAFDETKGDVKAKTAAGVAALTAAFASASKSSLSYADLQKEAAAEMQTGEKQMATALEKLKQAFAKPEITAALTKLLGTLPALADIVAKVVGFAADNPVAAGVAAGGAIFAKGALESAITAAFAKGGASAAASIGSAMAGGGSPLVGALGAFGPIALVLAASLGIMALAAEKDRKEREAKAKAEAEDAQKMLKGQNGAGPGAYQIAGALEAATGQEFDPQSAIDAKTAGQATANQDEHDKVMLERAQGAQKRQGMLTGAQAERFAAYAPQYDSRGNITRGTGVSGGDPLAGGVSGGKAAAPASAPAANASTSFDPVMFRAAFPAVQRVEVTNAKDIGGSGGGPSGGGTIVPGWVPKR